MKVKIGHPGETGSDSTSELTVHGAELAFLEDPLCARHIHCLLSSVEQPREISGIRSVLQMRGLRLPERR